MLLKDKQSLTGLSLAAGLAVCLYASACNDASVDDPETATDTETDTVDTDRARCGEPGPVPLGQRDLSECDPPSVPYLAFAQRQRCVDGTWLFDNDYMGIPEAEAVRLLVLGRDGVMEEHSNLQINPAGGVYASVAAVIRAGEFTSGSETELGCEEPVEWLAVVYGESGLVECYSLRPAGAVEHSRPSAIGPCPAWPHYGDD